MYLLKIKNFLKTNKTVLLTDIANHLGTSREATEAMIDIWVKKGRVRKLKCSVSCKKGCFACNSIDHSYYEWIE